MTNLSVLLMLVRFALFTRQKQAINLDKILDFPDHIMYNNKQVERYEGTVNSKLNIVNLTLQGGCPHFQIAGFYFYQ